MSQAFADTDPTAPFSEVPAAAKGAANDLRAAAGEDGERVLSPTEDKARQLKEAAVAKASQFRDFAGEKVSHLKDVAGDQAGQFRTSAEEAALQFKGVAGEQWQDTRVKARELHASMEDSVRKEPTKAVLIAAGVGFLAAVILRR
ncbi:hypothetical protein N9139_01450 [Akkermansiaceae bacterium]|nr:hypothetical protein [Akkermansiaceae bacterium]MDB4508011.1 hypothetical protein [Akkermansiaceae bacterium]